ncbi:uncharacterized protein LY79DRAFT_564331 [Colletotrichum navitas]|uniref:Uncharacterized protein n=1 Tax=Colletotrichum navitas TaxID=681940 RepID=A0AAD8PRD8_9PEZI|nr:uncharacterized protein LY79DRAFT_564331 [Colletotrichum navitas]KAK1579364.1 hypothetical protein LY79DRAFT_564331 [Colletotrichum navitas]
MAAGSTKRQTRPHKTAQHGCFPGHHSNSRAICVHVVNRRGNDSDKMNLHVNGWRDRFMTLCVGVKSSWDSTRVYEMGTSFAFPVAAGIEGNALG